MHVGRGPSPRPAPTNPQPWEHPGQAPRRTPAPAADPRPWAGTTTGPGPAVRTNLHTRAERHIIAKVRGILDRHVQHPRVDDAAAVADLHALTTNPDLLGHAWPADSQPPGWPDMADPWRDDRRRILTKAGAEPQPAWWEERGYGR